MERMRDEAAAIAEVAARPADKGARCGGIATSRCSFIAARANSNNSISHPRSTHYGGIKSRAVRQPRRLYLIFADGLGSAEIVRVVKSQRSANVTDDRLPNPAPRVTMLQNFFRLPIPEKPTRQDDISKPVR